jgi:hypothetical protein
MVHRIRYLLESDSEMLGTFLEMAAASPWPPRS